MTLPKELTTVTPLSKLTALILLIVLPILGFLFGMKYQALINYSNQNLRTFTFSDQKKADFTCPVNGWQNCMPILSDEGKKACSAEAVTWYKANCPNYQGIAQ